MYAINARINKLYFGALLQSESIRQNEIYQNDITTAISEVENQIKEGVANDYDLSLLEVELLKAKQTCTTLQANRNAYLKLLSLFIGRTIESTNELEIPKSLNVSMQTNMRPELSYYSAMEDSQEAQREKINSGLMPKIGLFGAAGYGRTNFNVQSRDLDFYGLVGIQLSVSFSDWYTESRDKMKIVENKRRIAAERDTFLFNANLDATQQRQEVLKYQKLIEQDANIVRLRTRIKETSFARLKNGVITTRDYIKELNAYDMAKQDSILHNIQKLLSEYEHKFITNN